MGPHEVVSSCSKMTTWPTTHPSCSSTGALIMSLTYGFDIKSHDDPFLAAAERALVTIEEATVPGAFLVDTFPICTRRSERVIRLLSTVYSETHSLMVPWSQVQALCTSGTKGS